MRQNLIHLSRNSSANKGYENIGFIFEILRHFPFYNTCTYHLINTMLRVIIIDRRPLFRLCIRVSKKGVSDELLETILPDAYACIILPVDTVRILVYWVVQVNIYLTFFFSFFQVGKKYIGYDQLEFCVARITHFDKE